MNMKTYIFNNKNQPITITISANSFEEAEEILFSIVNSDYGWRFDSEEDE